MYICTVCLKKLKMISGHNNWNNNVLITDIFLNLECKLILKFFSVLFKICLSIGKSNCKDRLLCYITRSVIIAIISMKSIL